MKNVNKMLLWVICIVILGIRVYSQDMFDKDIKTGNSQEKKSYDLNYKLKKGDSFIMHNMNITNNYEVINDERKLSLFRTRDLELEYHLIANDDTSSTFEAEYKQKKYIDQGLSKETVTTDFNEIIGKKVRYTISKKGNLSGFDGFSTMPSVKMPEGWNYTGRHLQEEIEHLFLTLPDEPVSIGDSWKREAFGVEICYNLIDEVKFMGFDCVRIFANIIERQSQKIRDNNGKEMIVEVFEPYSDIYYFAYNEGMMIYRFSVSSYANNILKDLEDHAQRTIERDILYETIVTF